MVVIRPSKWDACTYAPTQRHSKHRVWGVARRRDHLNADVELLPYVVLEPQPDDREVADVVRTEGWTAAGQEEGRRGQRLHVNNTLCYGLEGREENITLHTTTHHISIKRREIKG